MKRVKKMALTGILAMFAAMLTAGCVTEEKNNSDAAAPAPVREAPESEVYAVRTTLRELTEVDPEKGIGVYGRYTELTAEGEVPETLSRVLAEVNAHAKENVETKAAHFLEVNEYPAIAAGSAAAGEFGYRNISCIVNVTRADSGLFSILETEIESGLAETGSERINELQSFSFHASVYDTESGEALTLQDFMQDPGSIRDRLREALKNKYGFDGLWRDGETPAWTADYYGLRFYIDSAKITEGKNRHNGMDPNKAIHVSVPYTSLDGPAAENAAGMPERFIAQIEKNTDYSLPYDKRSIRVEKAKDPDGREAYRIVIRDDKNEEAWWLEYADDYSDYYVFRTQGSYYFYRLEDGQDQAFIYNFARPDGGFGRFENQNAQCFDSFMHELRLAVPYDPCCIHMRERARKYMDSKSGRNALFAPNGYYSFLPEAGRGRTWLHFSLIDDALMLDTRNVGCRLLHKISATALDEEGNENGRIVIPEGEVLRFLRVAGEGELYYYMSPQYSMYSSGARDYLYDCMLSDGSEVRLVTRYENSMFVDGMYLDRIAEPVSLGAAQYETGAGELQDHYVRIGGKEYKLIRDLSLRTETGEEIDFDGDVWWLVENYAGTYSSEAGDAKLVISEDGDVSFDYRGRLYKGKLPEKRYYRSDVGVYMESEYERRTFMIIVEDTLLPHDPAFNMIRIWSEGEPATNEPSKVPPIEAELIRKE